MGHGHHDFPEVPDYKTYKVEDAKELLKIQNILAQKGLKDPWLRNEVWRFRESVWGTPRQRLMTFFFRGFKYGFAAFVATIAIDKGLDIIQDKESGSGHH